MIRDAFDRGLDNPRKYILGIDIGKTKIEARVFEIKNGVLEDSPITPVIQPTQKGVSAHVNQICMIITDMMTQVRNRKGVLGSVGIGFPLPFDRQGAIRPEMGSNLGTGFDGVDIKAEYIAGLSGVMRLPAIHLGLDSDVMLAGMLETLKNKTGKRDDISGKQIALFGIGTGVGYSIAKVDKSGKHHPVPLESIISQVFLKVDDEDMALLQAARSRLGKPACTDTVRAAGLFSGTMINALAGVSDGRDIDIVNPQHVQALRFAGKYMARLVAMIKTGEFAEAGPTGNWLYADRITASKTDIYMVGGGMGRSALGAEIIKYAESELSRSGITGLKFMHIPAINPAVYGAAVLAHKTNKPSSRRIGHGAQENSALRP